MVRMLRITMKQGLIVFFAVMTIITIVYYGELRYNMGFTVPRLIKSPVWMGKYYWASKTDTAYVKWNTTDELGIVLLPHNGGGYTVYILTASEERALSWMEDGRYPIIKYNDEFYKLNALHADPSISSLRARARMAGIGLTLGWIITVALIISYAVDQRREHIARATEI